ncbi:MAG: hypothetical protein HY399_05525 [Elusimicrobia bacterium]|nr:hypothetical protein [Elusimicrobiota bacterium]
MKSATPSASPSKSPWEHLPVYLILAFYGVSFLLFKPWSLNFPLNDDWTYALGVNYLLQEGHIRICDLASPTQVLHLLWGAFCEKIGGGMGSLKVSTLLAAIGGALFFNASLKILGISSKLRSLAVLVLAANPLTYCLGFTFMTDVPYLCWMLLAFLLYLKSEQTSMERWMVLGSLAASGAYLIRQIGVFIPLGYSLYLLLEKRLTTHRVLKLWGIPLLTVLVHQLWFHLVHGPTWASVNIVSGTTLKHLSQPDVAFGDFIFRSLASSLMVGLMLFPFALGFLSDFRQFVRKKSSVQVPAITYFITVAYFLACVIFLAREGGMPHLENTLHRAGLGTLTVGGGTFKTTGAWGWENLWMVLTGLALGCGLLGIAALTSTWSLARPLEKAALHIFLTSSLVQFFTAMAGLKFFDRYLLILLPAALLVLVICATRWHLVMPVAYGGVAILLLFSVLGVQDYLAWNRAKWEVAHQGVQQGIPAGEIANGFDWDGLWTYEKNMETLKKIKPLKSIGEWEWQSLNAYKAFTSFNSQVPGRQLLAKSPYRTPFSSQTQYIYLWSY